MSGVPPGYCEEGSRLRNHEADSRRFMYEERRKAATWHARLKAGAAKRIEHEAACPDCRALRANARRFLAGQVKGPGVAVVKVEVASGGSKA